MAERISKGLFKLLDLNVMNHLFFHLDFVSLRNFACTCHAFRDMVNNFLFRSGYSSKYIEKHLELVKNYATQLNRLLDQCTIATNRLHDLSVQGSRPLVKMCLGSRHAPFQWLTVKWVDEHIGKICETRYCTPKSCMMVVQSGFSVDTYQTVYGEFIERGWKQVFVPDCLKQAPRGCKPKNTQPYGVLAFVRASHNHEKIFPEFKGCKKCHSIFHIVTECPDVICKICRKNGHVPRNCPKAICRLCRGKGHIVQHCPDFICGKCKRQGHTSKQCPLIKK